MKKKHTKVKKKERIIIPLEAIRYEQEEVDMFSDLPDPIIHQILSLLPTKQAEQTQILSKRWQNLWLTYPIIDLDFNLSRFIKDQISINESERGRRMIDCRKHIVEPAKRKLFKYMQRTLETRDLTCLQKLRIGRIDPSMQSLADKYIALALRNNVSVLDLSFRYSSCMYSVSRLLSLQSLIFLRLKSCSFDDYNSINLKSLKTLQLKCVNLNATKEIFCKMISSCPLLETLILIDSDLQDYSSSFEICHTSLKYLEVQHSHYGILELDVPKLLSLTCTVMDGSHRGRRIEIKTLKVDSLCSLTTLSLSALSMKEEHLQRLLLSSPHLERVGLRCKIKNNTPKIIIPSLKELAVEYCMTDEVSIMDVDTSNLESLIFKWCWYNTYKFRDLGDMGFGKLTKLSLSGDFLGDSCPKDDDGILVLSTHFPVLEDLSLEQCLDIEHLKFLSQSLKRLYVDHCTNLKDVNIDAPNLVFFQYVGYMIEVSNLIKSSQFEAELKLYVTENHHSSSLSSSLSYSSVSGYQETQLMKLRNFVKMFNETRLLTLINMSAKLIEPTLKEDYGRYNRTLLKLSYRHEMISIHLESKSIELKFRKSAQVEDGGRIAELVCVKVEDESTVFEKREFSIDFKGGFPRRMQEMIENFPGNWNRWFSKK